MKKIIALVIAIVMMAAIAVPAFATNLDAAGDAETTVRYQVTGSFSVEIPEAIVLPADVEGTSEAVNLVITANREAGKTVTVTVESANEYKLNAEETLAYELYAGESLIDSAEDVVATTTAMQTVTVALTAKWAEGSVVPVAAGTYSDTLTFTVAAN